MKKSPASSAPPARNSHPAVVTAELAWLETWIITRLAHYLGKPDTDFVLPAPPVHGKGHTAGWASWIARLEASPAERLLLALALAPNIRPELLDLFQWENERQKHFFAEFGLYRAGQGQVLHPTGQTFLFLMGGADVAARLEAAELLEAESRLFRQGLLRYRPGEAEGLRLLTVGEDYLPELLHGKAAAPEYSPEFPARRITTRLHWDDLVLAPDTRARVTEMIDWIRYGPELLQDPDMGRKLGKGYRALFFGAPGTGKTMTAALIGQTVGRDTYRIDLSLVVSKYIGETEKNLGRIFDRAEDQNWILFFDEADALFGKRTETRHSNDKYANQEVSYLLQRLEEFSGVVILASNFRKNIDAAFLRRFQSVVQFEMPDSVLRLQLWEKSIPGSFDLEPALELRLLAQHYEISGATVLNVVRFACVKSLSRGERILRERDVVEGIVRESQKEGKLVRSWAELQHLKHARPETPANGN